MINRTLNMNQLTKIQISDIAGKIRSTIRSQALKDDTLNNLLAEYRSGADTFYLALDLLIRKNEIFFLVTPGDTYVVPVG
jgi:hypothetical protein